MSSPINNHIWLYQIVEKLDADGDLYNAPVDFEEYWAAIKNITNLDDNAICQLISDNYGFNIADFNNIEFASLESIPENIARRFNIIPIGLSDSIVTIAVSNPFDQEMLNMISFLTQHRLTLEMASPDEINKNITKNYAKVNATQKVDDSSGISESAISEIATKMLNEAYMQDASDIHIEPFLGGGVVRYRIDGILKQITTLPSKVFEHLIQHLKSRAGMDVTNRFILQDGRHTAKIKNDLINLRISIVPAMGGEKLVIRLLLRSTISSLETINLDDHEKDLLKDIISNQRGIFLVTGPTGCGKSTTLNMILGEMNTADKCIVTVEDPVEFDVDGIAQVSINRHKDVTFSNTLRSFLRQDPDIILVGEIRDSDTAEIAMRAALTGHYVMSTLHTNDAITTISRLEDLNISKAIIADALSGLAAQRLLRALCPNCIIEKAPNDTANEKLFSELTGIKKIKEAAGCDHCSHSGYKGRFPILELVKMNSDISDAIRQDASLAELRKIAINSGMRPLQQIAIEKVKNGKTSVNEFFRVLGYEFLDAVSG
jgi:type II secretory ATPase GspE/PulE/Tfp pilus assembly ATPase PilB-like protein